MSGSMSGGMNGSMSMRMHADEQTVGGDELEYMAAAGSGAAASSEA